MRWTLAVAAVLWGLGSSASAQVFDFVHRMVPAARTRTVALAFGDFDEDGVVDAFAGDNSGPAFAPWVSLLFNEGTGSFADATATSLPFLQAGVKAIASGDVDGDGGLDAFLGIAMPSGTSVTERLLLNTGAGIFTDATTTSLPPSSIATLSVALGDVDGDGDLDAFLGKTGFSSVPSTNRLLLNDGTGVYVDVGFRTSWDPLERRRDAASCVTPRAPAPR
jgi:hypothetical protein